MSSFHSHHSIAVEVVDLIRRQLFFEGSSLVDIPAPVPDEGDLDIDDLLIVVLLSVSFPFGVALRGHHVVDRGRCHVWTLQRIIDVTTENGKVLGESGKTKKEVVIVEKEFVPVFFPGNCMHHHAFAH